MLLCDLLDVGLGALIKALFSDYKLAKISGGILSKDHGIYTLRDWAYERVIRTNPEFFQRIGRVRAHLLLTSGWSLQSKGPQENYRKLVERHYRDFPKIALTLVANNQAEMEFLSRLGPPVLLANNLAFLDESIYRPLPEVVKEMDALYVARFNRFKRHELARQVRSLGLVTYRVWEQVEPLHEIKVHWQLRHARLFNQRTRTGLNYQLIPPSRVVEIINQARVGLILSEEEGANNATMEYLLCGLPVVSTESIGARDEFFDPEHVRVVPPNSGAVAEAVRDLASRRLNPHEIRESVLAKMQPHRERFIRYVQSLYNELQVNRSFAEEWPKVFKDKFRQDPLN